MHGTNRNPAGILPRSLVILLFAAFAGRAEAARPATRPVAAPAGLAVLKAKLDAARADVGKARADVIKRLENSPQYKAAAAEVAAREKALAKAKAAGEGVEWAERILRWNRNRVARMRAEAIESRDEGTSRALDALAAARAAYMKAGGRGISTLPTGLDANRVVIVCDGSRQMINVFALLRMELSQWISGLDAGREFNFVLFGDPRASVLAARRFVTATREDKRRAYQFLEDAHTGGDRDPAAALEAAFACKPQAVYLLAGGDFTDNQAVLDQLQRLNRDRKVKVHALFFGPDGYLTPSAVDTLLRIAEAGGGTFDFLEASDLESALGGRTVR